MAAPHFSENTDKVQEVDDTGAPKFSIIFSYSLQKRHEWATYGKTDI